MSSWEEFAGSIELSREYHERYHMAIANPIRREILKLISKGLNEKEIAKSLNLSLPELKYHLQVLIRGFCLKERDGKFTLTDEGRVVDRI